MGLGWQQVGGLPKVDSDCGWVSIGSVPLLSTLQGGTLYLLHSAGSLARSQLVATPLLMRPVLVLYSTATAQMCTELGWTWGCAGVSVAVPGAPSLLPPTPSWGPCSQPLPGSRPDWLLAPGPEGRVRSYGLAFWIHSPGVLSKVPADVGQSWGCGPGTWGSLRSQHCLLYGAGPGAPTLEDEAME